MRDGESIEWPEILAEGLKLDEREFFAVEDVPPLAESAALAVTDGGAAGDRSALFESVLGDLGRGRSSASEESPWGDLVEGSRRRGEEAGRAAAGDPRRVSELGLLVEEHVPDSGAASDALEADARDFAALARGAIADGFASEGFVRELRGLIAEAEPAVAERRRNQLNEALAGHGGRRRRRRPYSRDEMIEIVGAGHHGGEVGGAERWA